LAARADLVLDIAKLARQFKGSVQSTVALGRRTLGELKCIPKCLLKHHFLARALQARLVKGRNGLFDPALILDQRRERHPQRHRSGRQTDAEHQVSSRSERPLQSCPHIIGFGRDAALSRQPGSTLEELGVVGRMAPQDHIAVACFSEALERIKPRGVELPKARLFPF
jgi:hypothetical protein